MDLEFKDVTYTVNDWKIRGGISKTSKQILKSVSGKFHSGQLTAIIGASGSGKTSLLNALSAYRLTGVEGKFTVGGLKRNIKKFHQLSCYITQDDLHQPLMTVKELMYLAATLKLPSKSSEEYKKTVIEQILHNLSMSESVDTRTEKLSGGEKKRLSIALELVNNPPLFFLDEPTSGLDHATSTQCIRLLGDLAKQDRTVICTIHQPTALILEQFNNIYVMAHGQCIYQGEPLALVPFLSSSGFQCPINYNPADYVIELTEDLENLEKLSSAMKNGVSTHTVLSNSNVQTNINNSIASQELTVNSTRRYSLDSNCEYASSHFVQFKILLLRMMLQIGRNHIGILIQTFHHVLCGILIGLTLYQTGNDASHMLDNNKLGIGIVMFFTWTQGMIPVLIYPIEVKLVKKEYFNRWYRLSSYYAALTISKLPVQMSLNVIFCTIVYFMVGYPNEVIRFILFCTVCCIVSFTAEGFGFVIGSIFNITNGSIAGPMFMGPLFGLAIYGFDFAKEISVVIKALMKTSFIRSGFIALDITIFGLDRKPLDCFEDFCFFEKPKVMLQYIGFHTTTLWFEITVTIAIAVIFRFVFYVALMRRFVWK